MGAFERGVESAFRHELNIFVDRQNQILSRVRITFLAIQHVPAGIERGQHATGNTMQIAIVLAFHASQAIVIGAHVSQNLGGELAVGIETLEFLLKIHTLEIQSLHARDFRRFELARDPGEISRGVQAGRQSDAQT